MNQIHRITRKLLPAAILTVSMTLCLQASATGDSAGMVRMWGNLAGGDNPNPWPFYDFRFLAHKVECYSGGVITVLFGNQVAHDDKYAAVMCRSPFASRFPYLFVQSTTNTPLPGEYDEIFDSGDSPDVGSHTAQLESRDWDRNFIKGECKLQDVMVGISKTTDSSERVESIHCSHAICGPSHGYYVSGNNCQTISLPPGSEGYCLRNNDVVVGVSVDPTSHQPHAIRCCALVLNAC